MNEGFNYKLFVPSLTLAILAGGMFVCLKQWGITPPKWIFMTVSSSAVGFLLAAWTFLISYLSEIRCVLWKSPIVLIVVGILALLVGWIYIALETFGYGY